MGAQVLGTAYGAPALGVLRAVVDERKRADPLAPVTIIAPTTIAGTVARRHLARTVHPALGPGGLPPGGASAPGTGVAGVYLTTVERLAEQFGAPALRGRLPATAAIVAAAWRAALDRDPDGVFAAVREHPATVTALIRAHRELRDLTSGELDLVAATGALPHALVALHRRVTSALQRLWYDPTELLRAATERITARPALVAERGALVLFLPQDLTNAEAGFVRALHAASAGEPAAGLTVVVGRTGVGRADQAVDRTLARIGIVAELVKPRPALAHRVRHASDSDEEVRLVVRDVVAALRNIPAHRIAVLYAAADPYARLLHEQLAVAGIATNGPGVEPVAERAIARGLIAMLRLLDARGPDGDPDLARSALFDALAAAPAYADLGAGASRAAGRDAQPRVPTARWERLSRAAGIVGGDDWRTRLDHFVEGQRSRIGYELDQDAPSQGRIDAAKRDITAALDLQRFAETLRARLVAGAAMRDWPGLSAWALQLFQDLYGGADGPTAGRLPPDEQYAAATVRSVLAGLAALADLEPAASSAGLLEVVEQGLGTALARVGRFGDGVFVGPMSAAIGLDVDAAYVVGLAEDTYPGRLSPDPLVSPQARAATGGALPSDRDRLNAAHRHLLAAFASAPFVQASFPRGNLRRSTDRLPSRWLLYTLRALSGQEGLAATEWHTARSPEIIEAPSFAASLLGAHTAESLATEQEWRTRAITSGARLDDPVIDAGVGLIVARLSSSFTRFDGNLEGAQDLPDFAAGERMVSPTALESYASCPHGYFVRRMLGIEPIEQPEATITISPLDIGNLIHSAMDSLVKEFKGDLPGYGQPWRTDHRDRLEAIAAELAVSYETSGATGHPRLWEHERRRILGDLAAMLIDDDQFRREHDAAVLDSELAFGKDGKPPVRVPIPDGEVLMLGSADKVDRTRGGVLVVTDIKTGGSGRYAVIKDDPVAAGTRLQLPVYAHAARQQLHADRVIAQYWFVRKDRFKRIPVDLNDAVEELYAHTLDVLVRGIGGGVFPAKAPEVQDFAWVQCPYCNPDGLGHSEARDRWERKRSQPELAALVALIDPGASPAGVEPGAGGAADPDSSAGVNG